MKHAALGEVCSFRSGSTLPAGEAFTGQSGGWLLLKVAELNLPENQELVASAREWSAVPPAASTTCPPDSIVLPKRGGAIATNKKRYLTRSAALDPNLMGVVPDQKLIHPRYLFAWLRKFDLTSISSGTTVPQLNIKDLTPLQIPLPSLPEQQRIADILDRAEVLRAKRHDALAQLDTLTQAIFTDMFGDPARNTRNLPTVALADLGEWQSGGTPPRGQEEYFDGDIPWFSSGELNEMYVYQSNEHISDEALRETAAKEVPQGALMMGMYDTAALKTSIAGVNCSCNQAIAFAAIDKDLAETAFVYFAILIGREHFRRLQRGIRQKNLNLSMIREIEIPLPPLPLQREFARRVGAVEQLRSAHRASLFQLDALFASLQHRAFRGEL